MLAELELVEAHNKRLHDLAEDTRKAKEKPGGITPEDMARFEARVTELAALAPKARKPEPLYVRTPLVPPPGQDARLFNLVVCSPEEIGWDIDRNAARHQAELQKVNDQLLAADLLMCGHGHTKYAEQSTEAGDRMRSLKLWKRWEKLVRAVSTSASPGQEWVPTNFSARLLLAVTPELRVAALFAQVDMDAGNYRVPFLGADLQGYFVPERGSVPAHDPVTQRVALTAAKIAARVVASSEMTEDAAIAFEPRLTELIGRGIGRGIEDACVNGDTNVNTASAQDVDMQPITFAATTTANGTTTLSTAGNFLTGGIKPGDIITGGTPAPPAGTVVVSVTNATTLVMNNSITAGTEPQSRTFTRAFPGGLAFHPRKAWDGLRKRALISNMPNIDLATFNDTTLAPIVDGMGLYGAMLSRGAWIIGQSGLIKFLSTRMPGPATQTTFLTNGDLGGGVVLFPGQVGQYMGSPVIFSEFVREDVNAAGAVNDATASGNTFTFLLRVNRDSYVMGRRRAVEVVRSAQFRLDTDEITYRGTFRGQFQEVFPTAAAANKTVGIGRNFN